jgi:hypothetical protein
VVDEHVEPYDIEQALSLESGHSTFFVFMVFSWQLLNVKKRQLGLVVKGDGVVCR